MIITNNFESVIGLEVHVQLKTKTKLFCRCRNSFGEPPNTNICPICCGHPGVLPVTNFKAIELLIKTALSLNCNIAEYSVFARKQYFYPDLPKNYQISQYELPLAYDGYIEISQKKIRIKRIHLEEDAGKLLHAIGSEELPFSLVDLNRTGIPLLEIVTQPDINSSYEAYEYLTALKKILQYLDVSDCDMEKGFLRCDANVSVRKKGEKTLGTKVEVKNMNSFKAIKEALDYEINRQIELITNEKPVIQETRLWNDILKITESMRTKEESHDYRYFPDPDLVPLIIEKQLIDQIRKEIPELPSQKKHRFIKEYKLTEYDVDVLTSQKDIADFFENTLQEINKNSPLTQETPKIVCNWICNELLGILNEKKLTIKESPVSYANLAELILLILNNTISGKIAKDIFKEIFITSKSPIEVVNEKSLTQITDKDYISKICDEVINENKNVVEEFLAGKEKAIDAIIGKVMKKTKGKSNPKIVNELLRDKLKFRIS